MGWFFRKQKSQAPRAELPVVTLVLLWWVMQGPNWTRGFEGRTHSALTSCAGWVLHACRCLRIQPSPIRIPGAKEKPAHSASDKTVIFHSLKWCDATVRGLHTQNDTPINGAQLTRANLQSAPTLIIPLLIALAQRNGCHTRLGLIFHLKASVPSKSCSLLCFSSWFV